MVKQHHARFRTAADTLQLTEAGQAQHDDTVVWAETYACKGDGNCLKRRGKCSVTVHIAGCVHPYHCQRPRGQYWTPGHVFGDPDAGFVLG